MQMEVGRCSLLRAQVSAQHGLWFLDWKTLPLFHPSPNMDNILNQKFKGAASHNQRFLLFLFLGNKLVVPRFIFISIIIPLKSILKFRAAWFKLFSLKVLEKWFRYLSRVLYNKLINSIKIKLCRPNKAYLLIKLNLQDILQLLWKYTKVKNKLLRGPQGDSICINQCDFGDESFTHVLWFINSYSYSNKK